MSTTPENPVDPRLLEQKRREINRLVEEVAKLSESSLSPPEYFAEFLQRLLTAIAAPAGAVWGRTEQGHLQLLYQINYREVGLHEIENAQPCHDELLRQTAQAGKPRLVPPQSGGEVNGDAPTAANLTRYFILLVPILIDRQVAGILEVWQEPDRSPQAQRGFLQFMVDLSEYAASYLRNIQLRQMAGREQLWTQLEDFARRIHGSLNPREVAYLIVNDARRLIQCDRVSVATRLGSSTQVEAISGADVIEKRSNLVQTMRALFDQVLIWGERLIYSGAKDDTLPPKVLEALDNYLAESNSKLLIIQPMRDEREADTTRPCRSAIMVEFFEPTGGTEAYVKRMEVIVKHAAPALYNALEYRRLPLRWMLSPLANVKDSLRGKPGAIAGAILGGVFLLIFLLIAIPYPLRMDAKGQLLPKERRIVYSRVTGPIVKVKVTNLEKVARDQELLLISDLELLSKVNTLIAQMNYAQQQRALYVEQSNRPGLSPEQKIQLENERIRADFEYNKAKAELDVLLLQTRKPREAAVTAPISGTVVTFDPVEKLEGRPVKPGDALLQVADTEGPWEIVIKIPEAHVGHIRDALNRLKPGESLGVDILLASHPDRTYKGRLYPEGLAGEAVIQGHETVLEARVEIDNIPREELDTMLVGAEAKVKVRCGPRPLGYVLFYELWEFFYERIIFWLF